MTLRTLTQALLRWIAAIPGEDGAEWLIAETPPDPQELTRKYGGQ